MKINPKAKDIFLIFYLPFLVMGFVAGTIIKATWAGVDLADKFTEWGAKR